MTEHRPAGIGRRNFLNRLMATTSVVATGMAAGPVWSQAHHHGTQGASLTPPSPGPVPATGRPFSNPPAISGANGNHTLDVRMRTANLGGQTVRVRSFIDPNRPPGPDAPIVAPTFTLTNNGQLAHPVSVRLRNRLPDDPHAGHGAGAAGNFDAPHGFNTTNLHTHGLHVDPLEDNVYIELKPSLPQGRLPVQFCNPTRANPVATCHGEYTYRYNFGKTPTGTTKIPAGTYWYHPHKHGSVGSQVASGMAGAFIVKGDLDEIAGVKGLVENVLVVQLIEYSSGAPGVVDPKNFYGINPAAQTPPSNTQMSVNGLINPTLTMRYGEIQRWRLVNATAEQFFYLNVTATSANTNSALGAPQLYAIAVDGVPLTNSATGIAVPYLLGTPPANPANLADAAMNEIAVLAPGQRLDLLVQMPALPAPPPTVAPIPVTFAVNAIQWTAGGGAPVTIPSQRIATIRVSGTKATADALPANAAFNAGALYRPPLTGTIPAAPTQNIQFGFIYGGQVGAVVNNPSSQTPFGASPEPKPPLPAVPAKPFALPSPSAQLNLKLNAVDLWQVSSDPNYGFGPHAFHIHINSFMMTQRSGVNIAAAAIWRDTARIDQPGQGVASPGVQFVSQQVDYVGDFVLHCHVLQHEDSGMMWSVNISS